MKYLGVIAVIAGIVMFVLIVGAVIQAPPDWTKYHIDDDEEEDEDDEE